MLIDFQQLQSDLSDCRSLLLELHARLDAGYSNEEPDKELFLNVKQAAEFLGIAPQTVYQKIKSLPHRKRFGKLYFVKSELVEYLKLALEK